ncbi:MAG: hypothetical protein ACP6IU_11565 [Candidatus Asgardarchaeia archaeon]
MKKGAKFRKKDLIAEGKGAKTVDRKIYELLSSGLVYPIPTIEDFRKYVYVSLEDRRSFDEVRKHLLDKISEYDEAETDEQKIIWYEIIMELELLYIKAKKNRLSATRILVLDLLWCAREYGEKIVPLLRDILQNVKEVMSESEIRKFIKLLIDKGFFIGVNVEVLY